MNSPLSFAHFSPWPFHRTRLAAPPGSSYDPEQTNIVRIGKGKDASCNTICKGLLVSGGFSSVESVWVGRMFPTFVVVFISCLSCFESDTRAAHYLMATIIIA